MNLPADGVLLCCVFRCLQAFEALEGLLNKNDICIAVKEKLKKDSGVAKEAAYDSIVKRLMVKERAKGQHGEGWGERIAP